AARGLRALTGVSTRQARARHDRARVPPPVGRRASLGPAGPTWKNALPARSPDAPLPRRHRAPAPPARDDQMSDMNPVLRWFHQLGSPPYFDRFAARWAPWGYVLGALVMAWGVYGALFQVPADYQQGDSFRIL